MIAPRRVAPDGRQYAGAASLSSAIAPPITPVPPPLLPFRGQATSAPEVRTLSAAQIEAIRSAMKLFVDDDLALGKATGRIYCDGCERPRPAAGVINYDRYVLCNNCAIEYEVARARGALATPGQYVRDKHFGDGDLYALLD